MSCSRLISGVGVMLVLACATGSSQSLADIARQNQKQKEGQPSNVRKVYTTDDLIDPACPVAQEPRDLSGAWSFIHFNGRFRGVISLCQAGSTLQGKWHTSAGKSEPDTQITGSVDGTVITLTRFIGHNEQNYTLKLSKDGNHLDGFGEGFFLHHTSLDMWRSGETKSATASPSTSKKPAEKP